VHAEQVTPVCATHGEGPVWDENAGLLRWVDMLAGDILALTAAGVDRLHVAGVAAALRPRAGGGLVVATERGFALVDYGGGIGPEVAAFTDPGARMNDGGADRQGRFLCGSMDFAMAEPRGALYRLDPDLQVTAVLDGVTVSNGICWTADGEQMYYIDSMTRQVDVFDYDTASGRPSGRRAHAVVDVDGAIPDGWRWTPRAGSGSRSTAGARSTATTRRGAWMPSSSCRSARSPRARSAARRWTSCSSPPPARTFRPAPSPRPGRCSASGRA
jgi:sugar lactone lactonase YvrE